MWTKRRIGNYLLLSLIPMGPIGFFLFIFFGISVFNEGVEDVIDSPWEALWALLFMGSWAYWWLALVLGIVLRIWGGVEENGAWKRAQGYAEMHGWQPISKTAWRTYKRAGVSLSVGQSAQSRKFLLNVDIEGEVVGTEGFDNAYFALNFGDYLWGFLSPRQQVTAQDAAVVVQQQRAQWEVTNLPALRDG